jgi:leader peptidase (prepilin peptidase)/N-methyltransferase
MIHTAIFDNTILDIIIIVFAGLIFGSFASALTYRVPRGLPWAYEGKDNEGHGLRSACPHCKTPLTIRDLIPVLSWLFSKGRCRHCGEAVSKVYPICEALTLIACIGIYSAHGLTWFSLPFLMMMPFLIALIMIDFEHMILPNQLVAILFFCGLATAGLRIVDGTDIEDIVMIYGGGTIIFGGAAWLLAIVMEKALKKEALGFGDVKFFAAAGIWLGLPLLGYFCILGGMAGVILAIIWKKITGNEAFPFGPALILAFYTLLLLDGSHLL